MSKEYKNLLLGLFGLSVIVILIMAVTVVLS